MVRRVFGSVSDSEGVTVCTSLLDLIKHEVGSPQMIVLPLRLHPTTSITTTASFLEAMPAFLNDLVQLMRAIYLSTTRDDGSSPELLARTSPHEIRWVGGRIKNVAGVAALSLDTAGGSAALQPTLFIVCSPNFNDTQDGPQNNILLQFLGKNAWPVGMPTKKKSRSSRTSSSTRVGDEVLEDRDFDRDFFFHIGRPEFQVGNDNVPPFDVDAYKKDADLEAFLTGNTSSLLVIYSD